MSNLLEQAAHNLARNGFTVHIADSEAEAADFLLREIPTDWSVGFGGSISLDQIGIYPKLAERGNPVYWHWQSVPGLSRQEVQQKASTADAFLLSSNAITASGAIVNTDGYGNRLAGLLYGHQRAFIVAGVNKLVPDLDAARIRIANQAAPPNTRRLKLETPCAETGYCMNCDSPARICNATLILHRQPGAVPITVCLVKRTLGF
ncbi:MAG TPA: LUD domain-containing protein [Clostridiales bacterium]|jgi:hypothetical protein|nr:LUD domain-containing protein [Clostridiales bacterium]